MKIGILGAGQLGRMLALAGTPLGFEFSFLDPASEACAARLGRHLRADYEDEPALAEFCAGIELATYEFENVPQKAADFVGGRVPLRPGAKALAAGQDRLNEKKLFESLGIPVPRFAPVHSRAGLDAAAKHTGLPAVLKTRRMGYDGKGQVVIRSEDDFDSAWGQLGAHPLILEAFVDFERELSCLAVRGTDGATGFYPLVENVHREGILRVSRPRARDPLQPLGEDYALRMLEQLDYVGVLTFEFFAADGGLLANEIAPRVHNSGHWSIEGAECSQFENHLRAIAGLPLGGTGLRGHSAMVNFIGSAPPAAELAKLEGVHIHFYGKSFKPGRKVGHATVLADNEKTLQRRLRAVEALVAAQ